MTRNATQVALFGGTATVNVNRKPSKPSKPKPKRITGRGKQGFQFDRLALETKPTAKTVVDMGRWQVKQRLAISRNEPDGYNTGSEPIVTQHGTLS